MGGGKQISLEQFQPRMSGSQQPAAEDSHGTPGALELTKIWDPKALTGIARPGPTRMTTGDGEVVGECWR